VLDDWIVREREHVCRLCMGEKERACLCLYGCVPCGSEKQREKGVVCVRACPFHGVMRALQ